MRVILFALFMSLASHVVAQEAEGVSPESPTVQEQPNGGAGQADTPSVPGFAVRILESAEEAEHRRDREQKSDQHEADDLAAQRKAADAAERSAATAEGQIIPTWIQAGVAVIGTAALLVTIIYSIRATRAAIRSADLAEQALAIARDTGKQQLRAYVSVSKIRFVGLHDGPTARLEVVITNVGATPALKVRSRVWTTVGAGDSQGRIFAGSPPDTEASVADLAQGGSFHTVETVYDNDALPVSEHQHVLAGDKNLYAVGIISYKDIFRVTRRTVFKSVLDMASVDNQGNGKVAPCRTGNRSS